MSELDKPNPEIPKSYSPWFRTAKGSTYYLNGQDGKTIRYKKVEGKTYQPQDVMVFVPDFKRLIKISNKYLEIIGDSEPQYVEYLLQFVQNPSKLVYVVNIEGEKINNIKQLNAQEKVYLFLGHLEEGSPIVDCYIPVETSPKINFTTYDTRKYEGENGEMMRQRHLGNKIVEIF